MKFLLSLKRFNHSVGVSETALRLAERYGHQDPMLEIAALLHDCGRMVPDLEIVEFAQRRHIPISPDIAMAGERLYHSEVGVYVAKTHFLIEHPTVTEAIRYHTTGKPGLSDSSKIIYIADVIEPSRSFKEVNGIREQADKGLCVGLKAACQRKLQFVLQSGDFIHPLSIAFWNSLCS